VLFGLEAKAGTVRGIRDITVLPKLDDSGSAVERRPFFTHTKYWRRNSTAAPLPHHIAVLREVLRLGE
jgi:hypothetical protein